MIIILFRFFAKTLEALIVTWTSSYVCLMKVIRPMYLFLLKPGMTVFIPLLYLAILITIERWGGNRSFMINSKAKANTNISKILEFISHKSELSDNHYPSSVIPNLNIKLELYRYPKTQPIPIPILEIWVQPIPIPILILEIWVQPIPIPILIPEILPIPILIPIPIPEFPIKNVFLKFFLKKYIFFSFKLIN